MCDFNVFKQVLITVGTTDFDELIDLLNVSASEVASYLRASGCCTVRVQIGRGKIEPLEFTRECIVHGIDVTHFRFASSMEPEILGATLVISHAGAGSVVETLNAPNRPYLVVMMSTNCIDLIFNAQSVAKGGCERYPDG
jgi:beta-1,4-N-acetylglucosaminyltransferase